MALMAAITQGPVSAMVVAVAIAGGCFLHSQPALAGDRSAPAMDGEAYHAAVRSTVDCIYQSIADAKPVATENSAGLFQISINYSPEAEQALFACKTEHLLAIELAYSSSIPFAVKKEATILQGALSYQPTR